MLTFPNAKINLGLNIVSKRTDGYHNIESCFYPISWSDALEIIPSDSFSFESTGIDIPGESMKNLCVNAFQILQRDFHLNPVKIHLHKVIPIGAGLGGGSADGAFAVRLLDQIFDLKLTLAQKEKYASRLGSDCSFFIENKPRLVSGTGNAFSETQLNLAGKWIYLIYPNLHISTGEAYGSITPTSPHYSLTGVLTKDFSYWREYLINDFEAPLAKKYPIISELKKLLYTNEASYASMTGSGSTVYGIFEEEPSFEVNEQYLVWKGKLE